MDACQRLLLPAKDQFMLSKRATDAHTLIRSIVGIDTFALTIFGLGLGCLLMKYGSGII
jgi:hypothetical protein